MALITFTQDEITTRVHEAYLALSGKKFDEEDLKEFIIEGKKMNDEKKIHYKNPYQLFLKSYYGSANDLHIYPDEKNKSNKSASEIWKKLQEYNYLGGDEKNGFSYFQKKSESYKERCIYGSEKLGYKGDKLKEWVEKELWPLGQTEDDVFEDIDDYFESYIRITNIICAPMTGIPDKAIKLDNNRKVCCIRNKTLSEKEDYYQKQQKVKKNYQVDVDDIEGKKIEERIEKQLNYMIAHPGAESTPYD